jgi:hypothetical protein
MLAEVICHPGLLDVVPEVDLTIDHEVSVKNGMRSRSSSYSRSRHRF